MNRIALIFISLFCCLTFLSAQKVEYVMTKYKVEMPSTFTSQLDVVYNTVGDWEGKMDLYLPPNEGKPTPIVINIHGGGWNHGSKEKQTGFKSFFKKDVAVANMSYRLLDVATAPAAIQDVRSVILYIIRYAEKLNIDTNKIILQGGSAGGHLALVAGYIGDADLFDLDRTGVDTVRIAAVINKYGIADMVPFSTGDKAYRSAVRWLGDKAGDKEFMKSISGYHYINKNTPPTFVIHGDADPIVPYEQSVRLVEQLQKFGVETEFITVPGGGHGKFDDEYKSIQSRAPIDFLVRVGVLD